MTDGRRIDRIVGGIYRISTFSPDCGITFNQFLIDDEQPPLIHTGTCDHYGGVRSAIAEVLDPRGSRTSCSCMWEGDENGGVLENRLRGQASSWSKPSQRRPA
jgi:hypothetical protein